MEFRKLVLKPDECGSVGDLLAIAERMGNIPPGNGPSGLIEYYKGRANGAVDYDHDGNLVDGADIDDEVENVNGKKVNGEKINGNCTDIVEAVMTVVDANNRRKKGNGKKPIRKGIFRGDKSKNALTHLKLAREIISETSIADFIEHSFNVAIDMAIKADKATSNGYHKTIYFDNTANYIENILVEIFERDYEAFRIAFCAFACNTLLLKVCGEDLGMSHAISHVLALKGLPWDALDEVAEQFDRHQR